LSFLWQIISKHDFDNSALWTFDKLIIVCNIFCWCCRSAAQSHLFSQSKDETGKGN